jgi:hypothetical protein
MNGMLREISGGEYSTLIGMNGGCPESPDGSMIVYTRKYDLVKNAAEVWVCLSDLTNHRKLCDAKTGNHNGNAATFVNDNLVVFRSGEKGINHITVMDVFTGEVVWRIGGKEGHRAEQNKFPFSNITGVYWLDCENGNIKRLFSSESMLQAMTEAGYTPNEHSANLSHVQLNPSATKAMMRISIDNPTPVDGLHQNAYGALLGCFDIETQTFRFMPNKPVHQLWYDDFSYMAVYQRFSDGKWDSGASVINRYSIEGKIIETLGGVGNHIDGSPDRMLFVGDSMYPDEPISIHLYKKGGIHPVATLDTHDFQTAAWERKVHSNPSFSADGNRVYFNRPVSDDKTAAVYVDVREFGLMSVQA